MKNATLSVLQWEVRCVKAFVNTVHRSAIIAGHKRWCFRASYWTILEMYLCLLRHTLC